MEYTHIAVGVIGKPLDLRVSVEWRAGEKGVRVILKDRETLEEFGTFIGPTNEAVPGETLPDKKLDELVWRTLFPYRLMGPGWTTHPISLASHFSLEWGWTWTDERSAQ
ncbi:hypothetical protein [Streptomyces sp. NPDC059874]|uniref:hypothetical protein n=1 Tax=Streptomyces sp. NPDC059874 TaxID=3346983 RepID=UPI00365FF8B5